MTIDTGIPSSMLLPGHFNFVKYGGSFGPKPDARHILVVGPKTSAGTATVNTLYDVQDDNHSDTLAGTGGFTAGLCRIARLNFRSIPIKLIIADDHVSGVAASGDITPSGTATSEGTLTAKIAGRTYTTTIEVGDTPIDVCEKLNLAINPTKLEMACRLATEIKGDYNTHKASAVYHTAADPGNLVAAAAATTEGTLVTLANDIRTCYEAHRVLVGGGPCHGQADTSNAISAAVCTDLATAVVLCKDLKAKFEAHRINTGGAPAVHIALDTTDVISAEDPVDEMNPHLPVTSKVDPATPKVTVTAKCKGTMGNSIMVRASTDAGGITFTEPTDNHLASGANEPDYSSAYAVAMSAKRHYIVPVTNVAATLTAAAVGLKARLVACEQPDVLLRDQAIIGFRATLTEGETLADSLDYERMQIKSLHCDTPPWEIAGAWAGVRCKGVGSKLSKNLANQVLLGVVPPEPGDEPGPVEIDNALHQGVSPLTVTSAGDVVSVYNITSRHTDGAGHGDLSVWGAHIIDVGDAIADDIVQTAAVEYDGYALMDDPEEPDADIPRDTMWPALWSSFIFSKLITYEGDGDLTAGSVAENKDSIQSEINESNDTRIDYVYPFEPVKHFLMSSGLAEQNG
jgi:phage tail sheath gpL-like